MKKSLIFVIIILLISLVAFPVIFAEGGTSARIETKNVDTEVLSNMDNYMKLNSPVAIDKTADYLAVANNREIFIQPQNDKKNAYYKTIDKDIEKLIVLGGKIIALTTSENITNLVVIDAVDKTEKPYTSTEYQNIISITKKNNQLAILKKSDEFLLFDITDDNNLVQSGTTTTLALGAIIGQNFKIINNFGYLMTNTGTIKQYNFNTNTLADFATLPNSIKDFYVSNDTIYYIDTNHKLFIGDKTIEIEDTKFTNLHLMVTKFMPLQTIMVQLTTEKFMFLTKMATSLIKSQAKATIFLDLTLHKVFSATEHTCLLQTQTTSVS